MIGTQNREALREDERDYVYSPDRPVPSFDARLGREQDMYQRYASADAVTRRPSQYQPEAYNRQPVAPNFYNRQPEAPAPVAYPAQQANRDELWQRLNTNTVSRASIEENMNFTPGQPAPFAPIKLRETQSRTPVKRRRQMSTQGKVILAVYLAVVLLIVTLVIVNAQFINTPDADVNPGSAIIVGEVNERGLSFAETPYNTVVAETNWFDQICDKLGD